MKTGFPKLRYWKYQIYTSCNSCLTLLFCLAAKMTSPIIVFMSGIFNSIDFASFKAADTPRHRRASSLSLPHQFLNFYFYNNNNKFPTSTLFPFCWLTNFLLVLTLNQKKKCFLDLILFLLCNSLVII